MSDMAGIAEVTDAGLAAQAAAGSRAAFEELVGRYSGRLFNFLRSRASSREDLEDLVQETFLKAYRNIERYNARWAFATWLYTMAVRLAIDRHRADAAGRLSGAAAKEPACPSLGPQETLLRREEAEKQRSIWNIAGTLGPTAYEALWLRYVEEMPVKDIARAMGKTRMGVRALLHRSRERLAEKLKAAGPPGLTAAGVEAGNGPGPAPESAAIGAPAGAIRAERKYSIL